eukprot:gene27659-33403_t
MVDPVSIIQSIYSLYEVIKDLNDTVQSNREEFSWLFNCCDAVLEPVQALKENPVSFIGKEKTLANLESVLKDIRDFLEEPRFKKERTLAARISEFYHAYSDVEKMKEFDRKLGSVASHLGLVLQINSKLDLSVLKDRLVQEPLEIIGKTTKIKNATSANEVRQILKASLENASSIEQVVNDKFDQPDSGKEAAKKGAFSPGAKIVPESPQVVQLAPINFTRLAFDPSKNKRIGQGSYGEVFACSYKSNSVALKRFPRVLEKGVSSQFVKSIRKEALIMQHVDHPNIIGFVGASLERGMLLMELALCSLDDCMYSESKDMSLTSSMDPTMLSLPWKVSIAMDVTRALRYLHAQNIIHRDIKPANVLLTVDSSAKRTVAKLTDFGLSQAIDIAASTAGGKATLVKPVGTIHYMAPELFASAKPTYSSATDVFALGVLLSELVVGKRPWQGVPDGTVSYQLVNGRERALASDWPAAVAGLKDRDKELAEALRRLAGDAQRGCLAHEASARPSPQQLCAELRPLLAEAAEAPVDIEVFNFQEFVDADPVDAGAAPRKVIEVSLNMDAQKKALVEDFAKWFAKCTPDVLAEKRVLYAKALIANKPPASDVDRLSGLLAKKPDLLRSLGFSEFDEEDVVQALRAPPPTLNNQPSPPQGRACLTQWMAKHCPDIAKHLVTRYAEVFVQGDVHTLNRLRRLAEAEADGRALVTRFALDALDAQDIAVALTVSADPAAPAPPAREQGAQALAAWCRASLPDVSTASYEPLARALCDAGVFTVNRLQRVVRQNPLFLAALDLDPLDAADIAAALDSYNLADAAASAVATARPQGEKALYEWMCKKTPGILLEHAARYAVLLCDANVLTVHRLTHMVQTKQGWLEALFGEENELDATDLARAVLKTASEEKKTAEEAAERLRLRPAYEHIRDAIGYNVDHDKFQSIVAQYGKDSSVLKQYRDEYGWTLTHWYNWSGQRSKHTHDVTSYNESRTTSFRCTCCIQPFLSYSIYRCFEKLHDLTKLSAIKAAWRPRRFRSDNPSCASCVRAATCACFPSLVCFYTCKAFARTMSDKEANSSMKINDCLNICLVPPFFFICIPTCIFCGSSNKCCVPKDSYAKEELCCGRPTIRMYN